MIDTIANRGQRTHAAAYRKLAGPVLLLGLALSSTGAVQAGDLLRQWGGFGAENGQFSSPAGIALQGNLVYVVDQFNRRVQVFDLAGSFLFKWGTPGAGDGQFESPFGIAIEGNEVYVTDSSRCNVQVFDLQGAFIRKWGSRGLAEGQFLGPAGIAIEGGLVYIADGPGNLVHVFTRGGDIVFAQRNLPAANKCHGIIGLSGQCFGNPSPRAVNIPFLHSDKGHLYFRWHILRSKLERLL